MEKQKVLRRQFILHIIYNMIAFSIIFIIFGIMMFFMVRNITFNSIDNQLRETQYKFTNINEKFNILYGILDENVSMQISAKVDNPQIDCIIRDKDGNIVNTEDLGKFYEYVANVSFDTNKLDAIYNLKIGEKYNYRVLTFIQEATGGYVQLLMNVDSENTLVDNYRKIITNAVILGIVLSSIASLVLSSNTLKPIEEVLKKQTEFVENVSHELRTPLTIIQAKQELLLQEPNEKIIDKSEEIMLTLNETKRLSKMIKDLTVILKGTNLSINDLQKQDIKMDELIQNIAIPYKEIAIAQEKKFKLNLNFGKDISVDTNKIHQLLVILLDNSIKYTEIGDTIEIHTFFKDNKCNIEVSDTGIGISDEGLKHVFDRFYREDKARNRETGGSRIRSFHSNYYCKIT